MKKLIVEALGTFFLAATVLFSGNPLAIGLMLMTMLYVGGHISGGLYNPAIALSLFVHGTHDLTKTIQYIIAQLVGGAAAAGLFYALTGTLFQLPATESTWIMMGIEALLTCVLCLSVLAMVTVARYKGSDIAGFVIGLTLVGIASIGGLFNPAIVVGGLVGDPIVHVAGPLIGGVIAGFLHKFINEDKVAFARM